MLSNENVTIENAAEERNYCVYIHTNKVNGKVYVGMTNNVERRWRYGGCEYKRCKVGSKQTPFWNAIEKYGWDNFSHEVVENGLTFEEAQEKEAELIASYRSNCCRYNNPSYGYNLTDGGRGSKGRPLTEEEKLHLSVRNSGTGNPRYGAKISDETKAKIGAANRGRFVGEKSPLFGKPLSEETREKLRQNHPDMSGAKNPRARAVRCMETGEVFLTLKDASAAKGSSAWTISLAAKDGHKTKLGHHWEFVEGQAL